MAKRIRVDVTEEDIRRGIPGWSWACPLALALHRLGYDQAVVGTTRWWKQVNIHNPLDEGLPLSSRAQRWVNGFDIGSTVRPATFHLALPDA